MSTVLEENAVGTDDQIILAKKAVRTMGGSWSKTGGKLGVKIPVQLCSNEFREEFLVNSKLMVIISKDPEVGDRKIPGLENAYPEIEIEVRVTQFSANNRDVTFSMSFDQADMPAQFLKDISHQSASIYILNCQRIKEAGDEAGDLDDLEDGAESEE